MATSLKDDLPIAKETFARPVQQVVQKDQARTQGEYDAAQAAVEHRFGLNMAPAVVVALRG